MLEPNGKSVLLDREVSTLDICTISSLFINSSLPTSIASSPTLDCAFVAIKVDA